MTKGCMKIHFAIAAVMLSHIGASWVCVFCSCFCYRFDVQHKQIWTQLEWASLCRRLPELKSVCEKYQSSCHSIPFHYGFHQFSSTKYNGDRWNMAFCKCTYFVVYHCIQSHSQWSIRYTYYFVFQHFSLHHSFCTNIYGFYFSNGTKLNAMICTNSNE